MKYQLNINNSIFWSQSEFHVKLANEKYSLQKKIERNTSEQEKVIVK